MRPCSARISLRALGSDRSPRAQRLRAELKAALALLEAEAYSIEHNPRSYGRLDSTKSAVFIAAMTLNALSWELCEPDALDPRFKDHADRARAECLLLAADMALEYAEFTRARYEAALQFDRLHNPKPAPGTVEPKRVQDVRDSRQGEA